ncbi:hypothetical protein FBU59_000868 [Linderina macrospora]|uniref:Uncharacterized protein n=1 Tax=Linderina macrospora TaxID=4868 RepID=A0ACC1JFF7_9FUNG|nr:hypothetical protein FBU59_000868 [Linderina macrospora]
MAASGPAASSPPLSTQASPFAGNAAPQDFGTSPDFHDSSSGQKAAATTSVAEPSFDPPFSTGVRV